MSSQIRRKSGFGPITATAVGALAAAMLAAPADAALVSACSGVRLQGSAISNILSPLVNNGVVPIQNDVNALLGVTRLLSGGSGLPGPLTFDGAGFLSNITNNGSINLAVIKNDGTLFGPNDTCNTTTDSLQLNTAAGLSLGGNKVTGLGGGTVATAGEINSIALGNGATTAAAATTSVALGNAASVTAANSVAIGAGSTATRGASGGSVGEVSVGAPGKTRQITNVTAGTAATDAVNVSQLTASAAAAPIQYSNAAAPTTPTPGVKSNSTTLVGAATGPVALHNVAAGTLAAGSTDAVNAGQLFAITGASATPGVKYFHVNSTGVDSSAVGGESVAIASGANALAAGSIAVGQNAQANNGASVAVGQNATAVNTAGSGNFGVAIGSSANANSTAGAGSSPIAIGVATNASGAGSQTAIGDQAVATGMDAIAIGGHAFSAGVSATGNEATAIGQSAVAAADHSLALGFSATVNAGATDSFAAGNASVVGAGATNAIAFGSGATVAAGAVNGLALGSGAKVNFANGVAIGQGSATAATAPTGTGFLTGQAAPAGEVSIGSGALIRRVTNVADGSAPTDAVTVAQLTAENAGRNALGTATAASLGGGAAYNPATGTVSAPAFAVQGATYSNVGAALGALNGATNANTTNITNLTNGINGGTLGLVQQTGGTPGAGAITVGAATGGTSLNVAGTAGNRVISGVAAGVAPTDAANVGQITAATANAVQYDDPSKTLVTLGGAGAAAPTRVTNVAPGALTAASTDAVNGSQLFATNANVTNNSNAITNLNNGTAGLVQQATPTSTVTVAAANGGTLVDLTGTSGTRTLTGVTAGANPTDAVNFSQLSATNAQVATNTGNIATNTANIATNTGNIATNTTAITNLSVGVNNGTVGTVQRTATPGQLVLVAPGGSGAAPGAAQVLSNVATGVAPTDAANVGQLGAAIGAATANAVQYDDPSKTLVTLGGAGAAAPTRVTNVAPGALTAASTDAVNGSQLFATNANVTNNSNAITNLNNGTAGLVQQATPTSTITVAAANGGTLVDLTGTGGTRTLTGVTAGANPTDAVNFSQLSATNAQVATNTGNIATNTTNLTNLTNGINNGTVGLVQQTGGSPGSGQITVAAATGGTSLSVAGTGGNRVISGVAAGVAPTDAANVSQLTGAIGAATANAVQYDTTGGVRANSVTLAGGAAGPVTVTNVAAGALTPTSTDAVNGSQLAATNAQVGTNTTNIAGNTTAITNLGNGTAGPVQRGAAANNLVLTAPGGTGAAPGTAQVLSNVAAGVAPTDAVNLGQVGALIGTSAAAGPIQYSNAAAPTTPTPGVVSNNTTLVGTMAGTPVALHNVAAGALTPTSTDAVNGSQLAATNANVTTNTANIAGNTTAITNLSNGTAGLVQQTGGAPGTGQITIGAATGGTSVTIAGTGGNRTLTGLANGVAANDAVTVAQVNGLTGNGLNNVQYDPTAAGGRSNTITLAGGAPGGVLVTNVAAGALTPTSTNAVNGSQLYATNTALAALTTGQAGAFQSNNAAGAPPPVATGANASAAGFGASATGPGGLALGNGATSTGTGSVALGQNSTDGGVAGVVSVGGVGSERRITNVGPAVNGTDAVNLSQLQAATNSFTTTTSGLQNEINQTNFDLNQVRRRANGGTAGAMAVAGLPQAFEPGKSMIGGAVGYWADQVAFAIGVSTIVGDRTVVKAGGSISQQGVGGFNAGVGFQF